MPLLREPAGETVRARIPLGERDRGAGSEVAVGDLVAQGAGHVAQLIDLQVPPLRHGCDTNNVLIDLHAHTAPRSNCSTTTLEELVASARSRGLDAICITEHDVRWPDDELAEASRLLDFALIPGVELTTDVGHVLVFGPLEKPLWMGYKLDELVAETEHTGTALVLPHPVRRTAGERAVLGGRTPPTPRGGRGDAAVERRACHRGREHADDDVGAHPHRGGARGGSAPGGRGERRARSRPGGDLRHASSIVGWLRRSSSRRRSGPATSRPSTSTS